MNQESGILHLSECRIRVCINPPSWIGPREIMRCGDHERENHRRSGCSRIVKPVEHASWRFMMRHQLSHDVTEARSRNPLHFIGFPVVQSAMPSAFSRKRTSAEAEIGLEASAG